MPSHLLYQQKKPSIKKDKNVLKYYIGLGEIFMGDMHIKLRQINIRITLIEIELIYIINIKMEIILICRAFIKINILILWTNMLLKRSFKIKMLKVKNFLFFAFWKEKEKNV